MEERNELGTNHLENVVEKVLEQSEVVVQDLLISYEERLENCRVTDENGQGHVLYNEHDSYLDLYTLSEEYTERFLGQLRVILEEAIQTATDGSEKL